MGTTLKPVPFFSDEIALDVDTASKVEHVGRHVTLREFAQGGPLALYRIEERPCRFVCYDQNRNFIEGDSV